MMKLFCTLDIATHCHLYRCTLIAVWIILAGVSSALAQEAEPRAYSNIPVGVNFVIAGYAYSEGGITFDPALPLKDPQLNISSGVFAYARGLDFWGKSGKVNVVVPYMWLSGSAEYEGERVNREVNGFGDASFRLSVNLYGAPALTLKEFVGYRQDLIIGVSLQASIPWGQYDHDRLVNIGANRWSFKGEVGISKAIRRWILELNSAVNLYSDNTDFYGGYTRSQSALYLLHGHTTYTFRSGIWTSFDITYFAGGRTTLDSIRENDFQDNWRLGGTVSFPIDRRNSVKINASSGVSARTGNNYDLVGLIWQYRWGSGL